MFILKIDKVVCFDADLEVFILKALTNCTDIVQIRDGSRLSRLRLRSGGGFYTEGTEVTEDTESWDSRHGRSAK